MARKIKKQLWGRYSFALILIVLGIFFMYQNIGTEFLGFDSLGNWLVYVGFVMIAIITLQAISIPYHLFMSYAMAYMMLVYFVSYKILEKYN
jgi:hypothetical protein